MKKIFPKVDGLSVGSVFSCNGKNYCITRTSLFTTNQTGDDQWYLFFAEEGKVGAIPYVMRPRDLASLGSVNINRISSPHPDSPRVGRVYSHYKGKSYKVMAVSYSPFEGRWFVVYDPLYEGAVADSFIRTLEDFNIDVGEKEFVPRFALAA